MFYKFFFILLLFLCNSYLEFKLVYNEYSGIKVLYISQMIYKVLLVIYKIYDCNLGFSFFEICINLIGNERSSLFIKVMLCNIGCGLSQLIFIQGDQVNLFFKLSIGIIGFFVWLEILFYIVSFGIIIFFFFLF